MPPGRIFAPGIIIVLVPLVPSLTPPCLRPPVAPLGEPIEPIVVLTTCPDDTIATRLARDLVEAGLAACVSRVGPVHSTFRWQGAIQDEPEVLLVIKTVSGRYPELEMRLKSLHPYDVPEIIALPLIRGSAEYLAWLSAAVAT